MQINPYLIFPGTCREAFDFYAKVLGGELVALFTHADMPPEDQVHGPEFADKVMHAQIVMGGNRLMGSDAPPAYYSKPQGSMVSITVDTPEEAERIYAAFVDGGQATMELQETSWARRFAMLSDRFGTLWMISCDKPMS